MLGVEVGCLWVGSIQVGRYSMEIMDTPIGWVAANIVWSGWLMDAPVGTRFSQVAGLLFSIVHRTLHCE